MNFYIGYIRIMKLKLPVFFYRYYSLLIEENHRTCEMVDLTHMNLRSLYNDTKIKNYKKKSILFFIHRAKHKKKS